MIKLEVQPYCADCLDFEASVKASQKNLPMCEDDAIRLVQTDTTIRCAHANRCKSLVRYLEKQLKGEEV